MEARVARLEEAVVGIQSDTKAMRQEFAVLSGGLDGLRQDVATLARNVNQLTETVAKLTQGVAKLTQDVVKLTIDVARIDGRVSQMPTLIQLITVVVAIWGMAFATLRFAGH
jgi:uncharacterized protein YoxC